MKQMLRPHIPHAAHYSNPDDTNLNPLTLHTVHHPNPDYFPSAVNAASRVVFVKKSDFLDEHDKIF